MTYRNNQDEQLERAMNLLADSVLGLSDEAILAEVHEAGSDPDEEAERTRLVLSQASQVLENINKRLSNLGHTMNPNHWQRGHGGYQNRCITCGSLVSFVIGSGEMQGTAAHAQCPQSGQHTTSRQEASR